MTSQSSFRWRYHYYRGLGVPRRRSVKMAWGFTFGGRRRRTDI